MVEKLTIEEVKQLLSFMHKGYEVPDVVYDTIKQVCINEIEDKNKIVLMKRDPNNSRDNIQSLFVKIIDGDTIQIYPAIIGSFKGDFDGDTMAVYAPLSEEAQMEAKTKMMTFTTNEKMYESKYQITKEALTGLFTLTYKENDKTPYKTVSSFEEARKLKISDRVIAKKAGTSTKTTAGRAILNYALPDYIAFINKPIGKKETTTILSTVLEINDKDYLYTMDSLMRLGFEYATSHPKSISIDMLQPKTKALKDLKEKLSKAETTEDQYKVLRTMDKSLTDYLEQYEPQLYQWVASGGVKDVQQLRQMMVSKGLISDPSGNPLPAIVNSITDGYDPETYFNASAGARGGLISKAIGTAVGGYGYRKILFAIGNVKADRTIKDCGTKLTLDIKLSKDLFKRMSGRYHMVNKSIRPITSEELGKIINIRSPIYCRSKGICRTCYGDLIHQVKTSNIGMVAAQNVGSLAEAHMKAFHTGGAIEMTILDIKKELLVNISDTFKGRIDEYVKQDEVKLIANIDEVKLTINRTIFKDKYKIKEDDNFYTLPAGQFILKLRELNIPVTFDQEIKVYKTENLTITDDDIIEIYYNKGDIIFEAGAVTADVSKVTTRLEELIAGKIPFVNIPSLFMSFFNTMKSTGGWDLTHLEVLISNILRNKHDPQLPARLKSPFEYQLFSIKTLPSIISWQLGLSFENMSKAVQYGLISDRKEETEIEKVMMGVPLSDEEE